MIKQILSSPLNQSDFQTLKEECKGTVCDCELIYVTPPGELTQRQLIVFISVNCSYRGLTEMPEFLPTDTNILHLSGNKVIYIYIILAP